MVSWGNSVKRLSIVLTITLLGATALAHWQFIHWEVSQRIDPVTDAVTTIVSTDAWSNPGNNTGSLIVRCQEGRLEIYFALGSYAELETGVTLTPTN